MLWVFPGTPGTVQAVDLVIITGQGTTPGVREVAAAFAKASGHKVTVAQEDGPALDKRLAENGPADLIASSPVQIADLLKRGKKEKKEEDKK